MSQSAGEATSTRQASGALTARMAAIECELARIAGELEGLRDKAAGEPALARLQLEATRVSQQAAEAAASLSALAPTSDTHGPAFAMTPLSLLCLDSEQLTLIAGIDATAATALNNLGIHRFADLAALTAEDVAEIGRTLGDRRRIARQNWIEQAALLASGHSTAHAARIRAGDLACCTAAVETAAQVQPAPPAKVVALASRRADAPAPAAARQRAGLGRTATIAASLIALAGVSLGSIGMADRFGARLDLGNACSTPIARLWSGCPLSAVR